MPGRRKTKRTTQPSRIRTSNPFHAGLLLVLQHSHHSSHAVLVWELGLRGAGEVDGGLVLFVTVNVLEVDDHVQGVGQHQQQNQRGDQAHQDGWSEEGCTVAC